MVPSQYRLASELVEMIHENFQGFHPGYRRVQAQGRYYAAIFKATSEAKKLSRAVHLQDPCGKTVVGINFETKQSNGTR